MNSTPIRVLLDCGASDCFISPNFTTQHHLQTHPLSMPISLCLFDGTLKEKSIINHIPLTLSRAEGIPCVSTHFLVSPLNPAYDAVLGLNWLTETNPAVNWSTREVDWAPVREPPIAELRAALSSDSEPSLAELHAAVTSDPALEPLYVEDYDDDSPPDLSGIPTPYREFSDVFSKAAALRLPPTRPFDHAIELEEDASPGYGPIYALSETERGVLKEFIDEHLAAGTIRPSQSPAGAPVLFVKKKDKSLRMVVDYRKLNRVTRKDRYPIPRINDLIERLGNASVFSKIDLRNAYHLLRVKEGDEWKTAFRTRYGSYEFCVMPFGLTNAPSSFQRFMNTIFGDLLDVYIVVYLDDILIFSSSLEEHRDHVKEVLRRLRRHGLYAKAEKCVWEQDSVEFVGFHCSAKGLRMSEDKVRSILDWPEPRNVRDIQSFLGFANFYRRFIANYSDIVVPLTRLLRKDAPWSFDENCRNSVDTLKRAFTSAPVLAHWLPDVPQIIETDASDYAIAAIHSIILPDGEIHPVAFHSRTLGAAERNYDTHDKELLAIFEAFKIWRHHLEGSSSPVQVFTDHKNLEYFSSTKALTRRQARWSEYLNAFNLSIQFRPGKLGAKPDALTRRWDVYPKGGMTDFADVNPENTRPIFLPHHFSSPIPASPTSSPSPFQFPVDLADVTVTTDCDTEFTECDADVAELHFGAAENTENLSAPPTTSPLLDLEQLRLDIIDALPVDPVSAQHLAELPSDESDSPWSTTTSGLLLSEGKVFVPNVGDLRTRVLKERHDHPLAGHPGQAKTLELIRRDYTWPKLRDDVDRYVKSCVTCGRAKARRHQPYGTLQQLPIPERPWHSVSMDFIEQLPLSSGFTSILVIVDRFTKQALFLPTTDQATSQDVAQLYFKNVFAHHGVPAHITSDRGSEFVSHFFRSLGSMLGIRLHFTSGYHPQGDGQTERINQVLEQYLRIHCNYQQDNWADWLPIAEFAYNNAESSATSTTPFFANKGYHPELPTFPNRLSTSPEAHKFIVNLADVHERLRKNLRITQERTQESSAHSRIPAPPLIVGDRVFLRSEFIRTTRPSRKLSDKFLGPFEIIGSAGPSSFILRFPVSMRRIHPVWHVSQLEPAYESDFVGRTQPTPSPVIVEGEAEHEVDSILDSRLDRRRRPPLMYLVKWSGYDGTPDESTWEPAANLEHAPDLTSEFHRQYPDKPGPSH